MRSSSSGNDLLTKEEEQRVHGMDAYAAVGMPHEFASQVVILANALNITIALRAGDPNQLYDQSAQPKKGNVKHKSGDWGLTKAVISDDPELGRYDDGKPKNADKQRPEHVGLIQHKLSLRSIMKRLGENAEVFGVAGDRYLLIKCKDAPTKEASEYIYRLDMKNAIDPEQIKEQHINVSPKIQRKKPEWWKDIWGSFSQMQDHQFNVEYIKNSGESYRPLEIYASKDKSGKLIPITSDMDLLWISKPSDNHPLVLAALEEHDVDILEVYNTFKEDGSGIKSMRTALSALCEVDPEHRLDLSKITDQRLSEIGCATAFEVYVILVINQRFAEFVNHVQDLLQHGADNRSPYPPSDIERTLHFIAGLSVITRNEKDLIKFMLNQEGYLKDYEIDLHPELDMKKWSKVVSQQISNGQKISEDLHYTYNQEKLANSNPLARKASAGIEAIKGRLRSMSFTFSSPQSRRKRSTPTGQRKSSLTKGIKQEKRRASVSMLERSEPTLCLEKRSSEIYKEEDAFLSKTNQERVIKLCDVMTINDPAWHWNMPMRGVVHGRNNGTNEDIYLQITNTSIELQHDTITGPAAKAMQQLQETLSPNKKLHIVASDVNKSVYEKWLTENEREIKKI